MPAADGVLGLLLFLSAGLGLAELLPAVRRRWLGERLALAWLLGVAWVAGSLYALSHLFAVPLRRPAVLAVWALPVAAGLLWRLAGRGRTPGRRQPFRRPAALPAFAFLIAAAVSSAVFGEVLTNPLRDWDGRMTWAVQARWVQAEGSVDARVLREPQWYVHNPLYPLLLPVAQVAVLEVTGAGDDEPAYRGAYAAFLPALLLLVYGGARRWAGRRPAALAASASALLPMLAFFPGGGATGAYSDIPLGCFLGGALLLLLDRHPGISGGVAAGLLLAAAALAKIEGGALALAVLGAAALGAFLRRRPGRFRRLRPVGVAAVLAVLGAALMLSWRSGVASRYDVRYSEMLTAEALWPEVVTRLPELLPAIRAEMIDARHWGLFWWVAPVVFLAGWRGLRRRVAAPLAVAAAAPLGLAWTAYAVSPIAQELVRTTWNRFLLQAWVPLALLFALALGDLLRAGSPRLPAFLSGRRRRSGRPGPPPGPFTPLQ